MISKTPKRKSEVHRSNEGSDLAMPPSSKKIKKEGESKGKDGIQIKKQFKSDKKGGEGKHGKFKRNSEGTDGKKGAISNRKKQKLSGIVTEAKANHQLFTDKKIDRKEKILLMNSTYELVKDHIAELSRIKGMGKVISALLAQRKDTEKASHVLKQFPSVESKVLLMKSNGFKLAIKLIKIGNAETKAEFVEACLTNSKGVRALMHDFKTARVLRAAYDNGNQEGRRQILTKLLVGNMPITTGGGSLAEIFAKCKADVVEGCRSFLESVINAKTIKYEVIQDVLTICLQTNKSTGMAIEEFVNFAADHLLAFCNRPTNSTLPLWIVWLASAQTRKHIMKSLKGKVASLLKTYNGRMFMMALLESTDDTKALEKFVLKEFLDSLEEAVLNMEVRKLLEFLLTPRSTKFMHPKEIEILRLGDDVRTSKKSNETRFEEIKKSLERPVLSALKNNHETWLKDNKLCLLIIAITERFGTSFDANLLDKIAKTLQSPDFSVRISDKAVRMVLEAFLSADIARYELNPEADLFINHLVPGLGDSHVSNLVSHCPRLISRLDESVTKLESALTFKLKQTWLKKEAALKAIMTWKHQEDEMKQNKPKSRKRK